MDSELAGVELDNGGWVVDDSGEEVELGGPVLVDEALEVELVDEDVVGGFPCVVEVLEVDEEVVVESAGSVVFGGGVVVVAPASVFAFSSFCLC